MSLLADLRKALSKIPRDDALKGKFRSCEACHFFKNGYCTQVQPPSKILNVFEAQLCVYYSPETVTTGEITRTERATQASQIDLLKKVNLIELITKISELTTLKTLETLNEVTNIKNIESVDLIDEITTINKINSIKDISWASANPASINKGDAGDTDWITPAVGKKIRVKYTCIQGKPTNGVNAYFKFKTSGKTFHWLWFYAGTVGIKAINYIGVNVEGAVNETLQVSLSAVPGTDIKFEVIYEEV